MKLSICHNFQNKQSCEMFHSSQASVNRAKSVGNQSTVENTVQSSSKLGNSLKIQETLETLHVS